MTNKITDRYLLPALLFCFSQIHAQITFNKTYDYFSGDEVGSQVLVVEDGYILTGNGWGDDIGNYFDQKYRYFKIDSEGHYMWKKSLGDTAVSIYSGHSLIQTYDGNCLVASGLVTDSPFISNMFLLKFDPESGDTIYFKIYESDVWQFAQSVEEYSDGTLLLNMYETGHPTTFMKTNSEGEMIWKYNYGVSNEGTTSIFKIDNDTLILITSFGLCEPEGFKMRIVDSSGSILSEEFIEGECANYGWRSKVGNDIIGGSVNLPENLYATHIYKMNEEREILWRYYSSWDLDTMYDFGLQIFTTTELENGDIYVIGYYAANPIGSYRGFVAKINTDGEPYWERVYTSNGEPYDDNRINDLALTNDGGIILAGAAYSNDASEDQNFWVLKLDSMGCLTPGCDSLDDAVFELPFNDEIVLFPNPASNYCVLQSGENFTEDVQVEIINTTGTIVQEEKIKKGTNSLIIQTNNLSEGVYILKIIDHQNKSSIKKLVISR
jgi:hypothetical protein